jgi:hypothetical protein
MVKHKNRNGMSLNVTFLVVERSKLIGSKIIPPWVTILLLFILFGL